MRTAIGDSDGRAVHSAESVSQSFPGIGHVLPHHSQGCFLTAICRPQVRDGSPSWTRQFGVERWRKTLSLARVSGEMVPPPLSFVFEGDGKSASQPRDPILRHC
jgi:hypothetical protein